MRNSRTSIGAIFILLVGMSLAGCTLSKDAFRSRITWEPVLASQLIEANVLIDPECKFTPDLIQAWKSKMNTEETISNYKQASCDAILDDMVRSRIFKRVVNPGDTNYDLLIKLVSTQSNIDEKIHISILEPERHGVLTSYDSSATVSPSVAFTNEGVRKILADIRNQMISDYQEGKVIKTYLASQGKLQTPILQIQQAVLSTSDVDELPAIKAKTNKDFYAIVIGIEKYRQKLPGADFATLDAKLVRDYLTKSMGYPEENVITLLDDRASNVDMVKYFEKWLPNNVEPGATVFVYYSGHGAPNTKTGDAYLVPYDGDPSFIDETGYSLNRMYSALGRLPAKEIVVALDSCFSGAGGRSVIAKGSRPLVMNLQSNTTLPKNLTVLAASSGDQTSSTYEEKGHGLFTYFMLKGIKNENVTRADGSLKIDDLYGYIKPQVERIARKQYNNEQTPQLIESKKD